MLVRPAQQSDSTAWEQMRQQLWPAPAGEHQEEIERFFKGDRRIAAEVLVAAEETGRAIAFVELSIRPYAEGCYSDRVAYLEGWFVEAAYRGRGIGRSLVKAAEEWARTEGCTEFASDTELDNTLSASLHLAQGFEEVTRIICFRKTL